MTIVSKFLSDSRQRVRLDNKVNASVDVDFGVPQGSIFGSLLFILCSSKLFHIDENPIVYYADDTRNYAVIPRSLSRPQVVISLNLDLPAIDFWCFK